MTATADPFVAVLWVGIILLLLAAGAWLYDRVHEAIERRNRRQMREWRRRMERR
jgi:uncharacterized membrane protein YidH (DUF202 family)